MKSEKLNIRQLCYSIDKTEILKKLDIDVSSGKFTGLIGPNGSGKSTLLRCVYRAIRPDSGEILLNGNDIQLLKYKDSAQQMAVLRQESSSDFDYSVYEVASMGRAPYHRAFEQNSEQDDRIIERSLCQVGLGELKHRKISTLSGGEKQRLYIARALVQQTELLILDEPTNHLDIYHKLQIMELIQGFDVTVLSAIHDLELACKYCDEIIVLKNGVIYGKGTPREMFCRKMFQEVFQVDVDLNITDEGNLQIAYISTI